MEAAAPDEAWPGGDAVAGWRTALGRSAVLWAAGGTHVVEPGWWMAFSGAKSVDYNAVLCHGAEGARDLRRSLEAVRAAKVPAVIMVAGPALYAVNLLAAEGWVCVDAKPLMVTTDLRGTVDPAARRLQPEELEAAQGLIGDAFDVPPPLAAVALPSVSADAPPREAWGLYAGDRLVSCVGVVTIDDTVVIWSMATPAAHQRQGYGRRLLSTVLETKRDARATTSVLYASAPGEPLYRALGYTVVEHWQVWSRPRWVFPPV